MMRLFFVMGIVLLAGCTTFFQSEDERLDRCQKKGISRDVCYQQDRADARAYLNRQKIFHTQHERDVLRKIGIEADE